MAQIILRRLLSLGAMVAGVFLVVKGAVAIGGVLFIAGLLFVVRGR